MCHRARPTLCYHAPAMSEAPQDLKVRIKNMLVERLKLEVDPASVLTPKEFEIFELLQNGLSNAKISEHTGVSVTTTKWHLKNIYSKLGVSSRTEAVLRASSR